MSLSKTSVEILNQFAEIVKNTPASVISESIESEAKSDFRDEILSLGTEGEFSTFFAPFDHINDEADIVIVGITPGTAQADEALLSFRSSLLAGGTIEDAAKRAKQAASFKGGMRTLGARLMDHFRLNEVFEMETTLHLFGKQSKRAHYTSVLRYPFLKKFDNFSGDSKMLSRPIMRKMINDVFAPEMALFPNAWIVPFGPSAELVVTHLADAGIINPDNILGGILHPGGTQWNRYNVQLEIWSREKSMGKPGGKTILERSDALHEKVKEILERKHVNMLSI